MQAILKSTTAFLSLLTPPIDKTSLFAISPSCGRIDLFGVTDGRVSYGQKTFAEGAWSEWNILTGLGLTYKTPPKAVIPRPGTMDVFVIGVNNTLLVRHLAANSWSPADSWASAYDGVEETGSVISEYEGRTDVYTRTADTGDIIHIYKHDKPEDKIWGHASLRQRAKSPPAVVVPGQYKVDVVWIGTDDYVHHYHSFYGRFSAPTTVGTQKISSTLTIVSNADGRVDLFALAPDKTVVHNSYQDTAGVWTGWETLGATNFDSSISAVVRKGSNTIELFGLGSDKSFWHRAGNGSHWPGVWTYHGGGFRSAPALVSSCPGEYDVFGIGSDKGIWYSHWTEQAGWTPPLGQWISLGGSIQAFP